MNRSNYTFLDSFSFLSKPKHHLDPKDTYLHVENCYAAILWLTWLFATKSNRGHEGLDKNKIFI